ncbi:MAG: putative integral rane protein [Miltoncostaeaceae bacterium]|nr:putative integral rane protein [Miltoncostaeaceae bacterium]
MPAPAVLLLFGLLAVHEGNWGFDSPWIGIGLAVWVLSFLVGMLFVGPESGRIARVTAERGADSPEAQARIRRIFLISRFECSPWR